ncbi:MAG: acyl CoA:acetate/3-ketoacid CoA transferase [Firmicutes bacterium]|nr:acyl CoA:acetate/3-ketoacid CoA transferase [Bacillota bacterium]
MIELTAREAAEKIKDNATIAIVGMGLSGFPDEIARAIADRYNETGHPKDLTIKQGSAIGDFKERGTTRFGIEGLVKEYTGAHIGAARGLIKLANEGKIQCHCLPQGMIVNQWREIASGKPGYLSKVGLHTFVDPRYEGGCMNKAAKNDVVKLVEFQGDEYLFYPSFKLDVALLRGTTADENGNITYDHEPMVHEGLAAAEAAKKSGGIVIVQVEYLAQKGSLPPKNVKIPGAFVDYVVVATDKNACWQSQAGYYDPSFCGLGRKPVKKIAPLPLDERKVIARRCAMELRDGYIINMGIGLPMGVARVAAEEGCFDRIITSTESGIVGGIAETPSTTANAEAIIDHGAMFDFIDGGGIDMTCLGMGELDAEGNVNVSRFAGTYYGPGGFIDLTQCSKKVAFCGTFTGKGEYLVKDGKITIIKEGTIKKILPHVDQITFNGNYVREGQEIVYITERCVLKVRDGKLVVTEIAPGIDFETQIKALVDFDLEMAPDCKLMDEGLFRETWGGLAEAMNRK